MFERVIKVFDEIGDSLEAKRGNFFFDILLEGLKIFNIYHTETSALDYGDGIQVVTPAKEPNKYKLLKE